TGLLLDPRARAEHLPVGAQQRLEIVKALARDARILILDEPTAVLAPSETDELLRWLRGFADAGNTVILITHKLREALAIADDVTVLRRGRVVLSARLSEDGVTIAALSSALLGGESSAPAAPRSSETAGDIVASMSDVHVLDDRGATRLTGATLDVRAGEVLGVAAVEGAGQRELLRVLAGRTLPVRGSVRLPTKIAFVPEDRHRDALILDFSAAENIALKGAGARRGRVAWSAERLRTRELLVEYDVRGGTDDTPARALSGGNQQKLVLSRELDRSPTLVVAENPTRGLDIRATDDVHRRLQAAARTGAAVVIYAGDLDEVLSLATRVVVVHATRVRGVPHDRDLVGRAMLGTE
ncbi:MAG: ATP-binding cassette domain-containing protein, partial [Solirubrobacteraceae bacterium]